MQEHTQSKAREIGKDAPGQELGSARIAVLLSARQADTNWQLGVDQIVAVEFQTASGAALILIH